ncbi:SDR family NAD(P)-dependent oxidoreductase [Zhengella sp. ZM62]|uniref:SDR family NAD(P)-dependent oxidoreductase n=1 Tax=Zhengella sedimenti TaxID=3390035 RepID=UPI003975FAC0
MADFSDRTAIVTGAGGEIGRSACLGLARLGARVLAVDLNEEAARQTADAIERTGGEAVAMAADVSSEADVAAFVERSVDLWGRLDVLINNAGWQGPVAPLTACTVDDFDRVMAINVRGVFLGMKHALPVIARQGGAVVNTASLGSYVATRNLSPYTASKHAVMGLTKTAALEVARQGVRVNAVCPGPVDTPLLREIETRQANGDFEGLRRKRTGSIPTGRYALPAEVADLMIFLVSDHAAHITGQGIHINGGAYAA